MGVVVVVVVVVVVDVVSVLAKHKEYNIDCLT